MRSSAIWKKPPRRTRRRIPSPRPQPRLLPKPRAFARREMVELRHDSVRLTFAVVGPLLLMLVFGYGISLDVNHLEFSVLDFDNTPASRSYADTFRGSQYYDEAKPLLTYDEMDTRLRNGELRSTSLSKPGGRGA